MHQRGGWFRGRSSFTHLLALPSRANGAGLMYKHLLPAPELIISSLHVVPHASPKNQNQESHGSAFSGSGSLSETNRVHMHGLGALSKTSTTAVMIKLTRALCHVGSLRGFGRLCIESSPGTAPHFLTPTLLIHDSPKSSKWQPMTGESVVFSKILK